MATNVTAQEKATIWKLKFEGYSIIDIASVVGRSKSTIKRILREG